MHFRRLEKGTQVSDFGESSFSFLGPHTAKHTSLKSLKRAREIQCIRATGLFTNPLRFVVCAKISKKVIQPLDKNTKKKDNGQRQKVNEYNDNNDDKKTFSPASHPSIEEETSTEELVLDKSALAKMVRTSYRTILPLSLGSHTPH